MQTVALRPVDLVLDLHEEDATHHVEASKLQLLHQLVDVAPGNRRRSERQESVDDLHRLCAVDAEENGLPRDWSAAHLSDRRCRPTR